MIKNLLAGAACLSLFACVTTTQAPPVQADAEPVAAQTKTETLAESQMPKVTPIVETVAGKVQGVMDDDIMAFKGVRYAAPPVGDLRFKPTQPAEAYKGVQDATALGAPCIQMYSPTGPVETDQTRRMQTMFPTSTEAKTDNEDCLFLNVWTPSVEGEKRPVMVWFHGGGYAYGSGGWPAYDGKSLSEKGDVVVVTVNHRLNVMGYLKLDEVFGEDFKGSGNAGNLDLVESLKWVNANIEAFGGDPGNVTIMGESGGGSKVSHMLATPAADGLFHKAVIQSGPGVRSSEPEIADELAKDILAEAGIETIDDLKTKSPDELLDAVRRANRSGGGLGGGRSLGPVRDGVVTENHPFIPTAPEQSKDIPVMIGWNKDEMTIFLASQPWYGKIDFEALDKMSPMLGENAKELVAHYREVEPDYSATHVAVRAMGARFIQGSYVLAKAKAAQQGAPVYMYWLTQETPVVGGSLKTPHTLDIPYMFSNVHLSRPLVGTGEEPQIMADMMSDAWISFAKTGTPSSELLPEWPAFTADDMKAMKLDIEPEVVTAPEGDMVKILEQAE